MITTINTVKLTNIASNRLTTIITIIHTIIPMSAITKITTKHTYVQANPKNTYDLTTNRLTSFTSNMLKTINTKKFTTNPLIIWIYNTIDNLH